MSDTKKPVEEEKKEVEETVVEPENTELESCVVEKEEYKNKYLRALADYQNMERRMRDERLQINRMAKMQTVLAFLPFLDNLEKAEMFYKDAGLKMIKDQFFQSLGDLQIKEIDILNKAFDPHVAEAIEVVEGDEDNIVVEILRKGFILDEVVLRVAQVKVSKKKV